MGHTAPPGHTHWLEAQCSHEILYSTNEDHVEAGFGWFSGTSSHLPLLELLDTDNDAGVYAVGDAGRDASRDAGGDTGEDTVGDAGEALN
jgi:hypothetical protein